MKHVLQIRILREGKFYTAECLDFPVITQGTSLDELMENLKEAISLHFEEERFEDYNLAPSPTFLANFEITPFAHA